MTTDYSNHLVLYSGGADSTYFIMEEETAEHLLHFTGFNEEKTKVANANAMRFGRHLAIEELTIPAPMDGEVSEFQRLVDT